MNKNIVLSSGVAVLALSACGGGSPASRATITETVTTTLTVTTPTGDPTTPTPAASESNSTTPESALPTGSTGSATETASASASDDTPGDTAGTTHELRWNQPVTTPLGNQISLRLGKKARDLSGKPCQYVVLTVKNGTQQTWDPNMIVVDAYTEASDKAESTPAEGQKVITDALDPGDTAWGQWCYTSSAPIDHARVTNADDVYLWHR